MPSKIVQKNAAVLRKTAKEVPLGSIDSPKVRRIIAAMKKAVNAEEDGVAIAAPQIGESLRIFVVAGRALSQISGAKDGNPLPNLPDQVFINPVLTKLSKRKRRMEEGCLSVRWLYGKVLRSERATIRAYDEEGRRVERGASGLLAQIFQHEMDHLDGTLFIDKATELEELPPQKHA